MTDRTCTHRRPRGLRRAVAALAVTGWGAGTALGQWPTEPSSPLIVGDTQGVTADHVVVTAPDGATWVAWIDEQCLGTLRLQRIDAGGELLTSNGVPVFDDPGCGPPFPPHLVACSDGSAVVCRDMNSLEDGRVQRIAADGAAMWGRGIIVGPGASGAVGGLLGASNGDVLIAWYSGQTIFVSRYAADGAAVWELPAAIPTITGSNKRIFAMVSDGADGAILLWDEPVSYVRMIWAARVTHAGAAAWKGPALITSAQPGSSRHTDPVAIADGAGGAIVVWTQGAEQSVTPVPVRMQRITGAGVMLLDPQGSRVSTSPLRQFDPKIVRDQASGDVLVAWREGGLEPHVLRAQRLTLAAARLWSDVGVSVTPLGQGFHSEFEACWHASDNAKARMLALTVADTPSDPQQPRVHVHRVDHAGLVAADPWPISGVLPVVSLSAVAFADSAALATPAGAGGAGAMVVIWAQDPPGLPDDLAGQRVNTDGTLGLPAIIGDVNGDGAVNIDDLPLLIAAWGDCPQPPQSCPADLDHSGEVGIDDLLLLIGNWG